jgi:hypothetical protein
MEFDSIGSDFQTCRLPQRTQYSFARGIQKVDLSPRLRQFLAFPRLTILALSGVDPEWFRRPVNPLCLGRSEDLVVEKEVLTDVSYEQVKEAAIIGQCLPFFVGYGTLYPAPLYFERNRRPVELSPKIDAQIEQTLRDTSEIPRLAQVKDSGEAFYFWDYCRVARQE